MTRVVLDTNVIVSAAMKPKNLEAAVLRLALTGKLFLFSSEPVLAEYQEVLHRAKFPFNPYDVAALLRLIREQSAIVRPRGQLVVCKDADDNRFLECAQEAKADFLVTGNNRHFPKAWKSTRVVNARELLAVIS